MHTFWHAIPSSLFKISILIIIYQHIAEVKRVARGGWKVIVFLRKLVALPYNCLHHLTAVVVDGSDDDLMKPLLLARDAHPWNNSANRSLVSNK